LTEDTKSCSYSLAGIRIDALKRADLLQIVNRARIAHDKVLILNHNLHSLYLYCRLPDFRSIYAKASWVYVDGMPVVWLARLARLPFSAEHRTTLLDSFDAVLEEAAKLGWRIFYLGSTQDVFAKGLPMLRSKHKHLIIEGHNGYFANQGEENERVLDQINTFRPDLLFVGMGMPTQERWLLDNYPRVNACSVITCGATLDYVTGDAYRPPAWVGPLGLYGVFRFFSDPFRLWTRYFLEPIFLFWRLLIPILLQRLRKTSGASLDQVEIIRKQS